MTCSGKGGAARRKVLGDLDGGRPAWLVAALLALAGTLAYGQSPDLIRATLRFEEARAGTDAAAALALGREALALADSDPVLGRAQRVDLLVGVCEVQARLGEPAQALASCEGALVLQEQQLGPEHPDLVPLLLRIGEQQRLAGRVPDAERTLQRAIAIQRAAYGPSHVNLREVLVPLQALYVGAGRAEDAARIGAEIEALDRSSRELPVPPPPSKDRRYTQKDGFAAVRVFYGTNRAPTGARDPTRFYGAQRGELRYGYLDVTIPESHKEGELESPSRWSMLSFTLRPEAARRRFVLLQSIQPLPRNRFLDALRGHMQASPTKELLVFVHGYKNTFEDASRRIAQLAYDLDFDGTPVLFSWPSQGRTTAYAVDEASVGISGRRLADFLGVIAAEAGATRVHLVAHSMGNRALLDALPLYLSRRTPARPGSPIGQVVFTAPDVDQDLFVDSVRALQGVGERLTLYASNNDLALKTSEAIHGAPRAGLAGTHLVKLRGLDSIDMSAIDADLLGHSYFAADAGAIYDLFRLIWRGDPPPRRCGMVGGKPTPGPDYWLFNVSVCRGEDLLMAGLLLKRFGPVAEGLVRQRAASVKDPQQKEEWVRIQQRLEYLLKNGADP